MSNLEDLNMQSLISETPVIVSADESKSNGLVGNGASSPTDTFGLRDEASSQIQREVSRRRLLLQVNSRLRLELLAALSKTFREHGVIVSDNLLSSIVFAISDELPGESSIPAVVAAVRKQRPQRDQPPQPPQPPPTPPPPPPSRKRKPPTK